MSWGSKACSRCDYCALVFLFSELSGGLDLSGRGFAGGVITTNFWVVAALLFVHLLW
jgi:hypothetical protein